MEVICLEDDAFQNLIDRVIKRVDEKVAGKKNKWVSGDEAMTMLRISSKTTLQKLRDAGDIRFSQPERKIILYDTDSIDDYLKTNDMDEELIVDPKFQKGFNHGYLLAIHEPELVAQIVSNKNDHNIYFKGLISGKQEYDMEKVQNRYKSMNQNDAPSRDMNKGKEK